MPPTTEVPGEFCGAGVVAGWFAATLVLWAGELLFAVVCITTPARGLDEVEGFGLGLLFVVGLFAFVEDVVFTMPNAEALVAGMVVVWATPPTV